MQKKKSIDLYDSQFVKMYNPILLRKLKKHMQKNIISTSNYD